MNIRKELLKQQKKALVYILTAVIGTTTLSGCSGDSGFEYQKEEDGTISVDGLVFYDEFKTLKLIHLTNEIAKLDKYFLYSRKFLQIL